MNTATFAAVQSPEIHNFLPRWNMMSRLLFMI